MFYHFLRNANTTVSLLTNLCINCYISLYNLYLLYMLSFCEGLCINRIPSILFIYRDKTVSDRLFTQEANSMLSFLKSLHCVTGYSLDITNMYVHIRIKENKV